MTRETPGQPRTPATRSLWWCVAAASVPFVFQYIYILNAFYHFGAVYFDAGLFANLIWHNDPLIMTSHAYGKFSYLGVHLSMLILLANQVSYLMPAFVNMVEYFASYMGLIYASAAAAMCYALFYCVRPTSFISRAGLVLLAIGFSFNGVIMQGVWMPHFEYIIPVGMFLFLLHYKAGHRNWALAFFILTLLMREDAGFHLTAVLVLLMLARCIHARRIELVKAEVVYTVAAFAYSLFACFMVSYIRGLYGAGGSVFGLIYMGHPPYAHLSLELLAGRALSIFREAAYLWTGPLVLLAWALYRKNLYYVVGFVAFIPWFIANWTAYNPNTGVLYAYYAFPFVLSMGWPCIAILWQHGATPPPRAVRDAVWVQAALVVAGLVVWNTQAGQLAFGPSHWARWGSYTPQWSRTPPEEIKDTRPAIRKFIRQLDDNKELGTVLVDTGVMSLIIGSIKQGRGLDLRHVDRGDTADTIAFFCPFPGPRKDLREKIRNSDSFKRYRMKDAPLCLMTNRSPAQLGELAPMLTDKRR